MGRHSDAAAALKAMLDRVVEYLPDDAASTVPRLYPEYQNVPPIPGEGDKPIYAEGTRVSSGGRVYVFQGTEDTPIGHPAEDSTNWKLIGDSSRGSIESPTLALVGMDYIKGSYYIDPSTDKVYFCTRSALLHHLPNQLVGHYFGEVTDPSKPAGDGSISNPIEAMQGLDYQEGKYYLDPTDSRVYYCFRNGTLHHFPSQLIDHYFRVVEIVEPEDSGDPDSSVDPEPDGSTENPYLAVLGLSYLEGSCYLDPTDERVYYCFRSGVLHHYPNQLINHYFNLIDLEPKTPSGTLEDPIIAEGGMAYKSGLYYIDPTDSFLYICTGSRTLNGLPNEWIDKYFERVVETPPEEPAFTEPDGSINRPYAAKVGMSYVKDMYYLDPTDDTLYICTRSEVLHYLPNQLVGHYFVKLQFN